MLEQIKEGRPHCWNRSKKENHIVGTDQRRKTTLLEQIKEGRLHCWNRSKKEDHIVGTDPISNIKMAVSILTIQIVVRIAANLILTTNDIMESIQ